MSLNRLERRAAIALALVFASRMLGLFMVLPVFALYAGDYAGATPDLIGLAIGAYGASQALLQIPFGVWSDRFGRKPLIYIGLLLFAAGSMVAASADHIGWVIVGRAIQGAGAISSVLLALLSDLTRPQRRTTAMAIIGGVIALSFTLSMVIGPMLAPKIGLAGLFWLTAAMAVGGMLLVRFLVADVPPLQAADAVAEPQRLPQLLRDGQLLRLNAGVLILHLLMTATFVALPGWLLAAGWAKGDQGWLYLIGLVASFLLLWPLLKLGKRHGTLPLLRLCQLLLAAVALGLALVAPGMAAAVTLLVVFFTAFNYLEASLPALLSRMAPAGARGSAMGLYSTAQFAGAFIGGAGGGLLLHHGNSQILFIVLALLALVWSWLSRRLIAVDGLKVVNYHLGPSLQDEAALCRELQQLDGVVEVRALVAAATLYLKVNVDEFDSSAAHAVIDRYSRAPS
ncbi:MAG: MFS transporter [Gammaproteobacteria bacterium]|nr:MFS transporter [Gammaproteobacteria bacterium]